MLSVADAERFSCISNYRHAQSDQHCLKHVCSKIADTDQATQSDARGHLVHAWLITCCKHAVSDMSCCVKLASNWGMFGSSPFQEVQNAQAPAVEVASP